MERLVYALDLGSTKVACIAAVPAEGGRLDVRAAVSVPSSGVYRGSVVNVDEAAAAIQAAIRKALQLTGESAIEVLAVGVGGGHLSAMTGQGLVPIFPRTRAIGRDDVLQVINHSRQTLPPVGHETIQAIPREFRVDGQGGVQRPIGMHGERLEVDTHIVTGSSEQLRQVREAVEQAGHTITMLVAGPVSSGLGVVRSRDIEAGCAVVDLGGGTTSVAVFAHGTICHTACIPVGAQFVTSDLEQLLKTSSEEAERLKLESGSAWSASVSDDDSVDVYQTGHSEARPMQRKVLSEIIESRMREIATFAWREIAASGKEKELAGGVLLTGGGSLLPQLDLLFESVVDGPAVRTARPSVQGQMAEVVETPAMAAAVGMAKYVLQEDEDEIAPASGGASWKETIRTLKSLFSGKA